MKTIYQTLITVLLLASFGMECRADEPVTFSVGEITYEVTDGTNVGVKSSTIGSSARGNITIPVTVEYNSTTYNVVSVLADALKDHVYLGEVAFPESVTAIGDNAFNGCKSMTVKDEALPLALTTIGEGAFEDCRNMELSDLPTSLATIGKRAFRRCELFNPTDFKIPDAVTAIGDYTFDNCVSLSSVNLNKVKTIGEYAFSACYQLSEVSNSVEVQSIGEGAFYDCMSLEVLPIPSNTYFTKINPYTFANCVSCSTTLHIPKKVTEIKDKAFTVTALALIQWDVEPRNFATTAFDDCLGLYGFLVKTSDKNLSEVMDIINGWKENEEEYNKKYGSFSEFLSKYVDQIDPQADVVISSSGEITKSDVQAAIDETSCEWATASVIELTGAPTAIGESAFEGMTGLVQVGEKTVDDNTGTPIFCALPASIREIKTKAFKDCTSLMRILLPHFVTIADDAFDGCGIHEKYFIGNMLGNLVQGELEIPDGTQKIYENEFRNFTDISGIKFPENNLMIENGAFSNTKIKALSIPSTVSFVDVEDDTPLTIHYGAFENCKLLESVTISDGVTTLPSRLFRGCSALHTISIPASVTSIGEDLLSGCTGLTQITVAEGNERYESIDGKALVDKIEKKLICVTGDFKYSDLSSLEGYSVEVIGDGAFEGYKQDEELNLAGVTEIGRDAFYGAQIPSVVIPNTVTKIGFAAFYGISGCEFKWTPCDDDDAKDFNWYAFGNGTNNTLTLTQNENNTTNVSEIQAFYKEFESEPNPMPYKHSVRNSVEDNHDSMTDEEKNEALKGYFSQINIVEEHTDGIIAVENGDTSNQKVYDLQGRSVKNPSKGVYVVGGKKVVIR